MDFNETEELEENIKIKNKAIKICEDFLKNVSLRLDKYKGDGKFEIWSDSHNAKYVIVYDIGLRYVCKFLHEKYSVILKPENIFTAIKNKDRVIDHLTVDSKGL